MTPMTPGYRPELDVSPLLDEDQASYYMSLIGILRWMVELGCIDICVNVSLLSSFMAQPRVGHMLEVLHVFSYLPMFRLERFLSRCEGSKTTECPQTSRSFSTDQHFCGCQSRRKSRYAMITYRNLNLH